MSWKALVRSRSFLVSAGVLLVVGFIWAGALAASARPPSLDDRVYAVASQLQCPICQGESVADSPSTLAVQMRAVIRAKLQSGESEQQVIQYFVDRYGDGIRQSPPKSGFTLLMWLAPLLMLLAGIGVVVSVARRWHAAGTSGQLSAVGASVRRPPADDPELAGLSEADLAPYRALLDAELGVEHDETPPPASVASKPTDSSAPSVLPPRAIRGTARPRMRAQRPGVR